MNRGRDFRLGWVYAWPRTMARPALLVVDPDSSRRRELARGLSGFGYEVVPAVDAQEGRRFAAGLGLAVVVAAMDLPGMNGTGWSAFAGAERTLLLLGGSEEEAGLLPREILFLPTRGLAGEDLVRRVRLVLLGREIGVEPDSGLESLAGDLALFPFLELLRALHRARVSGRVVLDGGEVHLDGGEVVAATAATVATAAGFAPGVRGEKAFCRLARREVGSFQVLPAGPEAPREGKGEIGKDLTALLILAIEDHVHGAPGPELQVRLSTSPAYFATPFTLSERRLLGALADDPTVGHLLDVLPGTDGEILRDLLAFRERGLVVCEEPRLPVAGVTGSAADLMPELARAPGTEVAPIQVLFGEADPGLGLLALFAARLARRGVPAAEISGRLADMGGRLHVLFVVDTIDDLARGGAVGRARAAFGNLLGLKPILGVLAGEVVVVDRVRGGRLAPPRLLELFRERVALDRPVIAGVAHVKAPDWADRLRGLLAGAFDIREILVTEMGPVVGTHAGPGTVGAVLFQPTDEELPLLAPLGE
ncbi:MAG: fatty acid kinase fatty acid binding subunit [Acidobacteriota bacterium]|nr:fatty acid kinase fatty acid binding subunit [Acidobacteriota bacterium]